MIIKIFNLTNFTNLMNFFALTRDGILLEFAVV